MHNQEIEEILGERQDLYGDAEMNFKTIGRIWAALLGLTHDIPAYQVALMMDSFKTVRCLVNPEHVDSWNDKFGYTQHGLEIARKL